MKPRSPDSYIDAFVDYLNRLLARSGFLRGYVQAAIHQGRVEKVELKLLPPLRPDAAARPCRHSPEELRRLFHNRLQRTLKLQFDFSSVMIEVDQSKIKRSFFTIQSLPEEKGYMGLVFRRAPPRRRPLARRLVRR